MSTIATSIASLGSTIKKPKISRKHLSRYSWLPDVLRLKGSIATKIVGPVLTVTLFATAVAYAWHRGHPVTLSNSVTPLLGVVVGLILVFRNGTSYDRYYEGRKDFGNLISNTRNLTRQLWINVNVPPEGQPLPGGRARTAGSYLTAGQLRKKKIKAIKLVLSFAYAVKHHLRREPGLHHPDYEGVLPPSFARFDETGFDRTYTDVHTPPKAQEDPPAGPKSRVYIENDHATLVNQHTPLLSGSHRTVEFHPFADHGSVPLPLIIAHELGWMIYRFKRDGFLETVGPAGSNAMTQLVQSMVDQLTAMERVANTPIPQSYGIHLKQCVTLYLFSLPFTLVRDLDWNTIPIVTVVAFTLMGIEGIANEIEMPFGTDDSDLPLDTFCEELKTEVLYMLERLPEGGEGMHGFDDGEGDD